MQDLPPIGGYEPVQWKRNLPSRGFRPSIYLAALGVLTLYGFYTIAQGIHERRELRREQRWGEWYLTPLLEAELERDNLRRTIAYHKRENAVMKDVEGWEPKYENPGDESKLTQVPTQFAFRQRLKGWWFGPTSFGQSFRHGQFWSFQETADEAGKA